MPSITSLELKLQKMAPNPIYIKRTNHSFKVNENLARKISQIVKKVKGRIESEITNSGNLDIDELIQFRIDKKTGLVKHLNLFEDETEKQGLDIICLIDCSGSMRGIQRQMRNITATIIKGLEKTNFVNFKVLAFSAHAKKYQGYIDEIITVKDAGRIQADDHCNCKVCDVEPRCHYHDSQNLAVDEARKILSKSDSYKKLILIITDGYCEIETDGINVPRDITSSLFKKAIINCNNENIETFGIFYNHIGETGNLMREIFKGKLYETENFEDVEKQFVKKLLKTIEGMNR